MSHAHPTFAAFCPDSFVKEPNFKARTSGRGSLFREEGSLESKAPMIAIVLCRSSAAAKWPALLKPTWWRSPKKSSLYPMRDSCATALINTRSLQVRNNLALRKFSIAAGMRNSRPRRKSIIRFTLEQSSRRPNCPVSNRSCLLAAQENPPNAGFFGKFSEIGPRDAGTKDNSMNYCLISRNALTSGFS